MRKKSSVLLIILSLIWLIILAQQAFNKNGRESFTFDYGDHKEYLNFSFNGVIYSYHHYFTNNHEQSNPYQNDAIIFNQDVSGFFFRFGDYYFFIPLKKRCHLGCELGLSLLDISLLDVFYIKKINEGNTVLLLPDRGVTSIKACKHTLSSIFISRGGVVE